MIHPSASNVALVNCGSAKSTKAVVPDKDTATLPRVTPPVV